MSSKFKEQHKDKRDSLSENSSKDPRDSLEEKLALLLETLPERKQRHPWGMFQKLSLMLTGGVALAGLFVGVGIWRTGTQFIDKVVAVFDAPQPPPKVDVRSVVVERVRAASELTTAVFAMEAVVPASRDRTFGGYTIGKTTLLYVAYGEVRAGVDLGDVGSDDVQVSGDTITLRLPPPQILDSKIDVNRSSVYDYDRGFLGLGPDVAPELQEMAQRETLKEIVEAACNKGLLEEANDRAETVVSQLLNTAGYQTFSIETQAPAADACLSTNPSSN